MQLGIREACCRNPLVPRARRGTALDDPGEGEDDVRDDEESNDALDGALQGFLHGDAEEKAID